MEAKRKPGQGIKVVRKNMPLPNVFTMVPHFFLTKVTLLYSRLTDFQRCTWSFQGGRFFQK